MAFVTPPISNTSSCATKPTEHNCFRSIIRTLMNSFERIKFLNMPKEKDSLTPPPKINRSLCVSKTRLSKSPTSQSVLSAFGKSMTTNLLLVVGLRLASILTRKDIHIFRSSGAVGFMSMSLSLSKIFAPNQKTNRQKEKDGGLSKLVFSSLKNQKFPL